MHQKHQATFQYHFKKEFLEKKREKQLLEHEEKLRKLCELEDREYLRKICCEGNRTLGSLMLPGFDYLAGKLENVCGSGMV